MQKSRSAEAPSCEFYGNFSQTDGVTFTEQSKNGFLCTGFYPVWKPLGLLFNGNLDFVTCYTNSRVDNIFDGGGSIGIFFRVNVGSAIDHQMLMRKGNVWRMMIRDKVGQAWRLHFIEQFSGNDKKIKCMKSVIVEGRWYHVVVSYNSDKITNKVKLFINGRQLIGSAEIDQGGAVTGVRQDDSGTNLTLCGVYETYKAVDGLIRVVGANSAEMQAIEVERQYEELLRICI